MLKKLIGAFTLAICLIALTLVIVSADPPNPKVKPHGKPTPEPGLQETQSPENENEKDNGKDNGNDNGKDKGRHGVFGEVSKISDQTFTLTTKQNKVFTITVTSDTRFHIPTNKNATFKDLKVGDSVAVNGTPTATGLVAKKVGIVPGKPSTQHRVGVVTDYKAGVSITIKDTKGETATFQLTSATEIRSPKDTVLQNGARVTVVSRRDPSTNTFTATAIVVHPN